MAARPATLLAVFIICWRSSPVPGGQPHQPERGADHGANLRDRRSKAFGASSRTLAGQFIVQENLVITLAGGVLAFFLSLMVLKFLSASGQIPHLIAEPNIRVFLYGLALAVAFGLVSGVYPAWKMSRLDPVHALNGGF
ncbi:MAG: FtsX-like permease family protein [Blastocatellia bacterium]|nr:FtsX-like permease family protein [Blastocatellia bacterium]